MKVVINTCFGGFSLSMEAVKRIAELNGRDCYFFSHDLKSDTYEPIKDGKKPRLGLFFAFDIPNPNEILTSQKQFNSLSMEERRKSNDLYSKHSINDRDVKRDDPILVKTVEDLGEKANGSFAKLRIVEIPDGTDYTIEEYDGNEHVAEVHRTWQ